MAMNQTTCVPAKTTWQMKKDSIVLTVVVGSWSDQRIEFPRSEAEKAKKELEKFLNGGGS